MFGPTQKQQTAKTTSIPAPVRGLNAKDSIAAMTPDWALVLDNVFCTPTTVDARNGITDWVSGFGGWVETITHYVSNTQKNLFACSGGAIYDVTSSASSPPTASVSGLSNNKWQTANFATSGGNFLSMVNGADDPQLFDGTTWYSLTNSSSPYALTGIDPTTLIHVNSFANRLWYVPVNSQSVWYLPVKSIAGALTEFPLGSVFQRGGYIMAMTTWTIDNTSGVQEYAVFISSEGEVLVYEGYDPDFSASFTLVGRFIMGRPVGRRCFVKIASDNCIICSDGIVSLSKELTTDRNLSQAFSYNIQNLINNDVAAYKNNWGWQPVYSPAANKLIINVPANEESTIYQYVMNTITGAWSTWNKENVGYTATCWDVLDDVIYCGTNGSVAVADYGMDDNGSAILWDIKPAYSYFGDLGQEKYFTMVRPIIISGDIVDLSYILCLDYDDVKPSTPSVSTATGAPWDVTPWDTVGWGASPLVNKDWIGIGGLGYAAALRIAGQTKGMSASLQSIDYVYEAGGVL